MNHILIRMLGRGLAVLGLLSIAGCGVLEPLAPRANAPIQIQVEQTVAAQMQVINLQATVAALETRASEQKPTMPPPTDLPTYTPPPTYTPLPTYTLVPSYTPQPTFTAAPVYVPSPVYMPTSPPLSEHPYILRVRNQNFKVTLWIGTALPYGGNFIEPLHYVEFYPSQPTWMRICWCRRSIYYKDWDDDWWDDWYNNWQKKDVYFCQFKNVYVDEAFEQFGVQ